MNPTLLTNIRIFLSLNIVENIWDNWSTQQLSNSNNRDGKNNTIGKRKRAFLILGWAVPLILERNHFPFWMLNILNTLQMDK